MATYQRIPTSPDAAARAENEDEVNQEPELSRENPLSRATIEEFNRPSPPWWQRAGIIFLIFFLGWVSIKLSGMGGHPKSKPEVIYATRYSDEFKYRPAASPVITEYLKDGRIRLRGATPGGYGVRPQDIPKSPDQIAWEKKVKKEEAVEKARKDYAERKRKAKARKEAAARKREAAKNKAAGKLGDEV